MSFVSLNIEYFPDPTRGVPVYKGYVYIGEPDTDPEIPGNQKTVTLQKSDGTQVITAQPLRTGAGGVVLYEGSPVQVLVDGSYSLKVLDKHRAQVYYVFNATGIEVPGTSLTLSSLRTVIGMASGDLLFTSGRDTPGDGGGGGWVFDTSDLSTEVAIDTLSGLYAAPSLDPTGASGAWVRQNLNKVDIRWFGATEGGSVDCSAAIQAAIDGQEANMVLIDDVSNKGLRFFTDVFDVVIPPGTWLINTELTIYASTTLRLVNGAVISAGTAGMTMIATVSDDYNITNYGTYASKRTRIIGGTIDGNDLAARGIDFDTCAQGASVYECFVIRCTHSKWDTTCDTTAAGEVLTNVASFTNVAEGDCLIIAEATGERRYQFMIKNFDSGAGTITLSNPVPETFVGTTIKHIAAGFTGRMFQQGFINESVFMQNHVGIALGKNYTTSTGLSFQCTDMDIMGGMCTKNVYCGMLIDGCTSGTINTTAQHTSNGPEAIFNKNAFACNVRLGYMESLSDAQFEEFEVGRTAFMQTVPMIVNYAGSISFNLRWPSNISTTTYRRFMYNAGIDVLVEQIRCTIATLGENPSVAGDFSLIEQQVDKGNIQLSSVTGQITIDDPTKLIIFSDGTYDPNNVRTLASLYAGKDRRTGEQVRYGNAGSSRVLSAQLSGDAHPRVAMALNGFSIGSGSAAVDTFITRAAVGVFQVSGSGGTAGNIQNVASKTTAELNDITDTINTVGKFAGKQVRDTTLGIPLYADTSAAGGVWKKFSDDTTAATPV